MQKYSLTSANSTQLTQALLFKLLACLCYGGIHVLTQCIAHNPSSSPPTIYQVIFVQYSLALLMMIPWAYHHRHAITHPINPNLLALRGLCGFLGLVFLYASFSVMTIAQAFSITSASPFITLLGAKFLLGETLDRTRLIAITIGLFGTYLATVGSWNWLPQYVDPSHALYLTLPIASALFFSLTTLIGRQIGQRGESNINMALWVMIYIPLFSAPMTIRHWTPLTGTQWSFALMMAGLTVLSQYFYNRALSLSEVTRILPIGFSKFIFSTLLAFLVLNQMPATPVMLGSVLIFASLLVAFSATQPGGSDQRYTEPNPSPSSE